MQPQPPNLEHKRMKREKKTIGYMMEIYCKVHQGTHGELCPECKQFKEMHSCALTNVHFRRKKYMRQMPHPLLPS
ncbi:MAG: nitrous oxide-stimulated promoter family protein [Candidatus Bathyarchaeia archaeon]